MKRKFEIILYYLLILFLPTQLGKHFWPDFAYVHGLRIDYLSSTVYFTDIIILLIFILWLFRQKIFSKQNPNIKIKKLFKYLKIKNWNLGFGIFLSYLLANVYLSGRVWGGAYSLFKLAEMSFLAYYTAKSISDRTRFNKILSMFCLSIIIESIMAIFQFLIHGSIGGPLYFLGERTFNSTTPGIANASINGELILRPYGTFSHPNVLAGYLVIVMILILFQLIRHCEELSDKAISKNRTGLPRSFQSLAMTCCLILGSIALFLTLSRVAILLWILIVGYFLLKLSFRALRFGSAQAPSGNLIYFNFLGRRSLHAFHLVGMTIMLLLFGLLLTPLGSRFTSLNLADEAVVQRGDLMNSAVKMLESSPLLGVGLGNFIPTLARQQKPLTVGTNLQPVHNIFLLIAAETGLIGLGFLMWLIFKIYQRLFYCHPELARHERGRMVSGSKKMPKLVRHDRPAGLIIAISSILALGMFDHYWLTLQQGQLLFAIIIGISFSNFKKTAHKSP